MVALHALATLLLLLSFVECAQKGSGEADGGPVQKQATEKTVVSPLCILPIEVPSDDDPVAILFGKFVDCACAGKIAQETMAAWDTSVFGNDSLADRLACASYNVAKDFDWKKHAHMRHGIYLARRLIFALQHGLAVTEDAQECKGQLTEDYYSRLLSVELEGMARANTVSRLIEYSGASERLQLMLVNAFQRVLAASFRTREITKAFKRLSEASTVYKVTRSVAGLYEGQHVSIRRHRIRPYGNLIAAITELLAAQKRPTYYGYLYNASKNSDEFAVVELIGEKTELLSTLPPLSGDGKDDEQSLSDAEGDDEQSLGDGGKNGDSSVSSDKKDAELQQNLDGNGIFSGDSNSPRKQNLSTDFTNKRYVNYQMQQEKKPQKRPPEKWPFSKLVQEAMKLKGQKYKLADKYQQKAAARSLSEL